MADDPFAAYGGQAHDTPASDPFSAYGGSAHDTSAQSQPKTFKDQLADLGRTIWQQVNPVAGVQGLTQAVSHPINTLNQDAQARNAVVNKAYDLFSQAHDAEQKGNHAQAANLYTQGAGHWLYGHIPLLGPSLSQAGQNFVEGNWGAGAGTSLGIGLNLAGPKALAEAKVPAMVGNAVGKVATPLAERIYQSALKPSTTLSNAERTAITQTGLQAGIPISEQGLTNLRGLIDDLNSKVSDQIQAGNNAGATVSPEKVAGRLDQTKAKFTNQVLPQNDLNTIAGAQQEFLQRYGTLDKSGQYAYRARDVGEQGIPSSSHSQATVSQPEAAGYLDSRGAIQGKPQELVRVDLSKLPQDSYTLMPGPNGSKWVKFNSDVPESAVETAPNPKGIPVQQAQALKTGTYQQLRGKYGELGAARVESEKALARGIKEELETQFPELKGMNAQEAQFINLDEPLERAVNRISNRNLISLGGRVASAATGLMVGGGDISHAAAGTASALLLHEVLTNPAVQSRLAIALSKYGKVPPLQAFQRITGYVNALGQYSNAAGLGTQASQ